MIKNLNITKGLIYSQRVMLDLTNHGFSREKAYRIVQQHAQNANKKNMSFYDSLLKDKIIMKKITLTGLKKMFDIKHHTKRVDIIFKRIFK